MKRNRITFIILIVVAAVAAGLYFSRKEGTLKVPLNNFAVKDTAAINKIFMADRKGNRVTLDRKAPGLWMVNNKFVAKNDAMNGLLYTIRNVEVKSPVGKNLYNFTMKMMASTAVKIEIYQDSKIVKTYYVGHPTMDNLGTFMYLEGSSVPFITHLPGFNGYLTTRYFTDETDWRDKALFKYDPRTITNVEILNPEDPKMSMDITRMPDSTYAVKKNGAPIKFETNRLRAYLMVLRTVYYDKLLRQKPEKADSILQTSPFTYLKVKSEQSQGLSMKLYRKPVTAGGMTDFNEGMGKKFTFDADKFYLRVDGDTSWYLCQYFHFNPVLQDPAVLTPGGPPVKPSSLVN